MPNAITYANYGGPDVLVLTEVDAPRPGPGQVRIRVSAASVNPLDLKIRTGAMDAVRPVEFPVRPGLDVAGVVDEAGEGAAAAVGDEVFGGALDGGYSEYALLEQPVAKPEGVSFATAAALVTVGETAYRVLHQLGAAEGETLLIHGAGGSVGTIAVQLAVARGITVVATAGEYDLQRLTALGATAVRYGEGWPERVKAAAPQGVDRVFDTSGAGVLAESVDLTGDADRVITIADMAAAQHGVRFSAGGPGGRMPQALPELAALAAAGKLDLPIGATYPLAEAARAHADIEAGRTRGKVVLLP
ncbi:NADP-dependent oxidoreductase [Streptomyces sp. PTM05]|uniref:NADP-dependent oxidoreductase n=1 Tax=Streptantibioticus parmotrematis TaxID=2873249 RepID=A0ABS7QWA3_9ACTN|nr:NADP-dependent oxidoreductase [Streptantibioticus parmotrematis]MBY8886067.1 NADP-dependent oxidoreductase [Streptantibioticus parmotrematis]